MPNWGFISTGPTFQSLVNTLLLFDDPTNRVFGRPGRDGGLDARSNNGETIWQAKYHQSSGIDQTLTDARKELVKITQYRDANHARFPLWQRARNWILVTNLRLNANDHRRWEDEIVPLFQPLGLAASIWGEEKLEALLTAHPHVERSYFGGTNRFFWSLGEAYDFLDQEGPRTHGLALPIIGRNPDLDRLEQFLTGPKKIICVHGVGGVGKSRLLFELGARQAELGGRQILWGNVESMAQGAEWFTAISPEQPTLLLLDEPADERLISILAEQLRSASGRMSQWKVIVAMRSPKDPILKAYRRLPLTMRDEFYPLNPPAGEDASLIARSLIDQGPLAIHPAAEKDAAVQQIVRITGGVPVWIVLAIKSLENTNSLRELPADVADIARTYLEEVIDHQPEAIASKRQITALIRWLAIYHRVNSQDEELMEFLVKITQFSNKAQLISALQSLVNRRFAVNRGIQNRLYEIKPDVMRDFVLSDWLLTQSQEPGQASTEAAEVVRMVVEGFDDKPLPQVNALLQALAVTEIRASLAGSDTRLLNPLIATLRTEASAQPVTHLQGIVGLLDSVSFARVKDTVDILRTIRLNPKPPVQVETIFGPRTLTHGDVVKSLSWSLFTAGQYAQTEEERVAVLEEMIALFLEESKLQGLPTNDGKRSKDLIPRLIAGGSTFLSNYEPDAYRIGLQKLREILDGGQPTDAQLNLCKTFIHYFVTVERSHTHFSNHNFSVTQWVVNLAGPEGERRRETRNLLREMTESPVAAIEKFAWALLVESHMSAGRSLDKNLAQFRADLKDDLVWVKTRVEKAGTTLATIKQARALWHWHAEFEQDPELKAIALECEDIHQSDPQVQEFDVFFNFDRYAEVEQAAQTLGARLATQSSEEISEFLTRAEAFSGPGANWGDLFRTTAQVAGAWETNPQIPHFVRSALRNPGQQKVFDYAAAVLDRRLCSLRTGGATDVQRAELNEYFALPPNPEDKLVLLLALYFRPHPSFSGLLNRVDFEFFAAHIDLFSEERQWQMFRCLGGMFYTSWPAWKILTNGLLAATPKEKKGQNFLQMFDAIFFIASFRDPRLVTVTQDQYDWILGLIVDAPDLDELQGHVEWQITQWRNAFPLKSVKWLNDSLQHRLNRSRADSDFKVAGMNFRLSSFVEKVTSVSSTDAGVRFEVARLLCFMGQRGRLAYHIPRHARSIDPEGLIVPEVIITEMQAVAANGPQQVANWSRLAEQYPKNSDPWRRIAAAACTIARGFDSRGKNHIFNHLEDGTRSSSHPAGEMDPQPAAELEQCLQDQAAEQDPALREYRQWAVDRARAVHEHTVESFNEEMENQS
jgi:hypothetical protein